MKRNESKELILFIIITFAFSWALWIPQALNDRNVLNVPDFILSISNFGAYGPLVAALGITFSKDGKTGIIALLKRAIKGNFRFSWYLVIFLTFPLLFITSLLLAGVPYSDMFFVNKPEVIFIGFFLVFFTMGPLQEELGWRGFALDRLQKKWSALVSSIILGLLWEIWHLPLFYMIREDPYYNHPIWGLILSTVLISILFTWIYNNTGRSILGALLFHTMWNFSHWLFPVLSNENAGLYLFVLLILILIPIIIFYKPSKLARKKTYEELA